MEKQTLFISYCWKDGNTYADELETQLKEKFDVKRDKSQLIANDDIYDFMTEIINCDNVILILTSEYVKSLNCMLEMSYLVAQDDWAMKSTILVVDDSLYSIERKLEVINYWILRQTRTYNELNETNVGISILEEEKKWIDDICLQIEGFFKGVSRRKNPSQIAIVNEVIKKSNRDKNYERKLVQRGEDMVLEYISDNPNLTLRELAQKTNRTYAATNRWVSNLLRDGKIKRTDNGKYEVICKR